MKGTEKQIAWAMDIKNNFIAAMEYAVSNANAAAAKVAAAMIVEIDKIDNAGEIIDMFGHASMTGTLRDRFISISNTARFNPAAKKWWDAVVSNSLHN